MTIIYAILLSITFYIIHVQSLECYIGYSVMKGSTIGSSTKICEKETDYCYNATADVSSFSTVQKAGCNTLICQFNGNKCFNQEFGGKQVTFCCCNEGNLCNGGQVTDGGSVFQRGLSVLRGMMSGK